ncbi:hypothetical protein [Kitasatospora fiedleri]|nr:hypothetical protein [Kitasatospora fiedleri]
MAFRLTFAPALMLRPMNRNAVLRCCYERIAQTVVANARHRSAWPNWS